MPLVLWFFVYSCYAKHNSKPSICINCYCMGRFNDLLMTVPRYGELGLYIIMQFLFKNALLLLPCGEGEEICVPFPTKNHLHREDHCRDNKVLKLSQVTSVSTDISSRLPLFDYVNFCCIYWGENHMLHMYSSMNWYNSIVTTVTAKSSVSSRFLGHVPSPYCIEFFPFSCVIYRRCLYTFYISNRYESSV